MGSGAVELGHTEPAGAAIPQTLLEGEAMTYLESCEFCDRQKRLWEAEHLGLLSAQFAEKPLIYTYSDQGIQERFEMGWKRGKEQLHIESATKEATHASDATPQ